NARRSRRSAHGRTEDRDPQFSRPEPLGGTPLPLRDTSQAAHDPPAEADPPLVPRRRRHPLAPRKGRPSQTTVPNLFRRPTPIPGSGPGPSSTRFIAWEVATAPAPRSQDSPSPAGSVSSGSAAQGPLPAGAQAS